MNMITLYRNVHINNDNKLRIKMKDIEIDLVTNKKAFVKIIYAVAFLSTSVGASLLIHVIAPNGLI